MIVAEVKVSDGDKFDTRVFNSSLEAFQRMADRRFVAIGRVAEMNNEEFIAAIKQQLGWL